jgi:hypothetical protein
MPLQPLVPLPPLQLPRPLLPQLAVVEDRDLLVLVVKVTRVARSQPLIPPTSDSLTVAAAVEISGRSGRTSG